MTGQPPVNSRPSEYAVRAAVGACCTAPPPPRFASRTGVLGTMNRPAVWCCPPVLAPSLVVVPAFEGAAAPVGSAPVNPAANPAVSSAATSPTTADQRATAGRRAGVTTLVIAPLLAVPMRYPFTADAARPLTTYRWNASASSSGGMVASTPPAATNPKSTL